MATTYDVSLYQGDSWTLSFKWQDANGDPIDIDGATVRAQIRKRVADQETVDALVEITTDDGVTVDTINDEIVLALTPEQTASLHSGKYVYDVEVTTSDDKVTTPLRGKLSVIAEVSR